MRVKFNILFPRSMYIAGEDKQTMMRVKNIKALKQITDLGLKEAKEFVESCERDYDGDYTQWGGVRARTSILTAEQWGVLHALREMEQCSFFAEDVTILADDDDVTDFSRDPWGTTKITNSQWDRPTTD